MCPFSLFIFFSLFSLSLLFLKNFERRNAFYYDERDVGYDDFDEKRERERERVCVREEERKGKGETRGRKSARAFNSFRFFFLETSSVNRR